jgi:hypothetical protein
MHPYHDGLTPSLPPVVFLFNDNTGYESAGPGNNAKDGNRVGKEKAGIERGLR